MPAAIFSAADPPDGRPCDKIRPVSRSESNLRVSDVGFSDAYAGRAWCRRPCAWLFRRSPAPTGPAAEESHAHRHARRARPCRPISPICPTSIPTRRRAAGWSWGLLGTFDSLNPLIVRGLAVQQIRGYVVESLMARGNDEPFTLYGLLARSVETDDAQKLTSPSISIPGRAFPTASRCWPRTCCSPGPCCATTAVPTTASIIPRSRRPKRPIR